MGKLAKQFIILSICLLVAGCSSNKEVSFKSGGMTHTFQQGQGSATKNFPLPIYPGSTTTGAVAAEGEKGGEQAKFLMLSSPDSLASVTRFYKRELKQKGWTIENIQELPNLISIQANRTDLEANVMIAQDNEKTTVSLGISKEADNGPFPQAPPSNYVPDNFTPPTD